MSSTVDEVRRDSQNLRKPFRELKIYTSKLAQFVLQWQDLEDHFLSIKTQVEHLEQIHQTNAQQSFPSQIETLKRITANTVAVPSVQSPNKNPERKIEDCNRELSVQSQNEIPENENNSIPIDSGESLVVYLNEHLKERKMLKNTVYEVFKRMSNPGKLVLEALRLFYPSASYKIDVGADLCVTRRNCMFLLEELKRVGPLVESQMRNEALEMALDWELKMKKSMEVLGFLVLVAVFGLVDEFNKDDLLKHFDKVLRAEEAPELFRAFGFADKVHDFIQKLIDKNKRLEAIPFIYAFEVVHKFPPVPLLRAHSEYAGETYNKIYEKGNKSLVALDNATGTQLAALKGILKLIGKYKLHSEYSPEIIRNQILQLKEQKDEKKAAETSPKHVVQPQKQIVNKRNVPSGAQPNLHDTYKRLRTEVLPSSGSVKTAGNSKQAFVFNRSEDRPYVSPSSGRTAPATGVTNVSASATLTRHSMLSQMHTTSFLSGQGAQQLISPSGLYSFGGFSQDTKPLSSLDRLNGTVGSTLHTLETSSMAGQYGSGFSGPLNPRSGFSGPLNPQSGFSGPLNPQSGFSGPLNPQYTSIARPYGSHYIPHLSSLVSQYGSNDTNGDTGQFGFGGFSYTNRHFN